MQFTKLRLAGFKSFVEPTDVLIEPGLTGVVGPNGCGKSNLVEALRWVMGESSYKGMRASGMDDVIFAGTGKRPSRNTAEVGLFIDNRGRTAPADFNAHDQLEVSRRIERGLGSDYRVNGKGVRARDVQLLFADASSGARSPALVRQGQVSELIEAKPTARRHILEDAAGISGLHSRRHEAELRLRAAEQNLERVEDVAGEIDKQVEGLRRQARQAKRYRALSAEIRKAEAALFHIKWTAAKGAVASGETAVNAAKASLAEATATQTAAAREQAIAAHRMPDLRQAEAEAAAALARLKIAAEQLGAEETRVKERLAALDRQLAEIDRDRERESKLHQDAAAALATLDREEEALARAGEGFENRKASLEADSRAADAALAERERAASAALQAAATAEAEARSLKARLAEAEALAAKAAAEVERLERAASSIAGLAEARSAVEAGVTALAAAERDAAAAETAAASADEALPAARDAETAARDALARCKAQLAELTAEARAIETVLARTSDADGFAPVIDRIEVDKGFEAALAAALGDDLEAALDAEAPVRWSDAAIGAAAGAGDPALPTAARPLAAVVRAPAALARRLAQIGIVSAEEAAALQPALAPGQRLVSTAGDLWRWDGFVARADAPSAAAQRLAQRNRLDELRGAITTAEADCERAATAHAAARDRHAALAGAEKAARQRLREAQATVGAARNRASAAEGRAKELEVKAAGLNAQREAADSRRAEADAAREAAAAAFAEAPSVDALKAASGTANEALAAARSKASDVRARLEAELRQDAGRRRQRERIAKERSDWATRLAGAETYRGEIETRRRTATEEREALSERPADIDRQRRALSSEIAAAEEAARIAGDRRAEAERAQSAADQTAKAALEALSAAREAAGRAEERLIAAGERLAAIESELSEALEVEPWRTAELAGISAGAPLPEIEAAERTLARLKAERERLGGVNLRADVELQEMEERVQTLTAERDDLIAAIAKLRQAIHSLNREARERLLAAFGTVSAHFERLFKHLFDGGEASLQLVDSDDPLEAGLDIIARPPGKKPQVLSLLSGGEQALTATALIFAVFLTNPAPICVLDEIDAPLDDANVERFCALLDEMTRQTDTRFLVITHNPITMAHMHRLYGVTMAEKGISQLVSVSLEAAEELAEAV